MRQRRVHASHRLFFIGAGVCRLPCLLQASTGSLESQRNTFGSAFCIYSALYSYISSTCRISRMPGHSADTDTLCRILSGLPMESARCNKKTLDTLSNQIKAVILHPVVRCGFVWFPNYHRQPERVSVRMEKWSTLLINCFLGVAILMSCQLCTCIALYLLGP